jgi:hypothetical protein
VANRKVEANPVFEYRHLLSVPKCPGYLGLHGTNGLFLIDEQGNTLAHFLEPQSGIHFDRINHLYEDENGDFWLAHQWRRAYSLVGK